MLNADVQALTSLSSHEADAKFPNQSTDAIPPSPSRENPGQVYPRSDPKAAPAESVPGTGGEAQPSSVMGNPFALKSAFSKLDSALNEIISTIEGEGESVGSSSDAQAMVQKFEAWRMELNTMRSGSVHTIKGSQDTGTPQEGGMFAD
ncbi:hypothetical protein PHLCEN_2v901 [Hermanssonia centrifuga]|uniref:Uncharacterized protein n=1 Tax=Hermanssonia centrifuga TaxID=98765 RepID=A0A2R6S4T7_9APHY|nr:hypothetical protein PHLCEN_2v901 [Hermanssonia centrifuga]